MRFFHYFRLIIAIFQSYVLLRKRRKVINVTTINALKLICNMQKSCILIKYLCCGALKDFIPRHTKTFFKCKAKALAASCFDPPASGLWAQHVRHAKTFFIRENFFEINPYWYFINETRNSDELLWNDFC